MGYVTLDQSFIYFCKHVASFVEAYDDPLQAAKALARAMKFILPYSPVHNTWLCISKQDLFDEVVAYHVDDQVLADLCSTNKRVQYSDGLIQFKTVLDGIRGCQELLSALYYKNMAAKDLLLPKLWLFDRCVKSIEFISNSKVGIEDMCDSLATLGI